MLPEALIGHTHFGAYLCADWELRITARCLAEDLGAAADSNFDDVSGHEIVKALVKDRFSRTEDRQEVNPLTCGKPIWVLSRGHDHRGATFHDSVERVVWLVAYGRHRSGDAGDFYKVCTGLDASDRLLPTADDYDRLYRERAGRFTYAARIQAPLILRDAREHPGREIEATIGGKYGVSVAIEVADDLEQTTVAFRLETVPYDYVPVILAALHPSSTWDFAVRMPARELESGEFAFTHLHGRE